MAKYKFKKGVSLGALAAEHDALLKDVFVDAGYLDKLIDAGDSAFLILGRAGSGKTALVRTMQETQGTKNLAQIDPEELSMQYLQNSVLREISTWGVNLEIFYKYLWRHVFILALVRARFGDPASMPQKLTALTGLPEMFFRDTGAIRDTQAAATSYLQTYSDQFWIGTDTKESLHKFCVHGLID